MNKHIYTDLNLNFYRHPGTNDIIKRYDMDAIKTAVINILRSNTGDKLFNRSFGANLREALFEPITPFFAKVVEDKVTEIITQQEPRVSVLSVKVQSNDVYSEMMITVEVALKKYPKMTAIITETLRRVR